MNEFDATVELLKAKLKDAPLINQDEWLRLLYESYTRRFISDNERIWTTGAIMIPLSLGGFVALATIESPTALHIWLLALSSLLLMLVWLVIAENHRAFQDKSYAWIRAIECVIGLEKTGEAKVRESFLNRLVTFKHAARWTRWFLALLVLLGWISVLLYWPRT